MSVKLWRNVAVNRTGGVVLELGRDELACSFRWMIPADTGLGVVFELVERHTESAPFNTMKDLFLAAAAWGVKKNLSVPLAKRVSVFTWTQFSLQEDIPFIHALLVSSGIGLELLLEQAKLLDLLEGYANGGIDELSEDLVAAGKPTVRWINKVLAEVADAPEPA